MVKLALYAFICILHSIDLTSQVSRIKLLYILLPETGTLNSVKSQAYSEMMDPCCNLIGGSETAQSHFANFKVMG